jgi:hypothetical protein
MLHLDNYESNCRVAMINYTHLYESHLCTIFISFFSYNPSFQTSVLFMGVSYIRTGGWISY